MGKNEMSKVIKILAKWFDEFNCLKISPEGIPNYRMAEKEILELLKEEKIELKNEIIQDAYNLMETDYGTNNAECFKRDLELLNQEE